MANGVSIVANLKAYLNNDDLRLWITTFISKGRSFLNSSFNIIICPPSTHLQYFRDMLDSAGYQDVSCGIQNISQYSRGAYTGDVTANMCTGFADYAIIGHSERRRYYKETHVVIAKKLQRLYEENIKPIICMEEPETYAGDIFAVAYEPAEAIGTGHPEPIEEARIMLKKIKEAVPAHNYLYGGSINKTNIIKYVNAGFDGVLIGSSSTNPQVFFECMQSLENLKAEGDIIRK